MASQMGKLKRGGIPDREKAARILLGDWNSGKIKYFTHPPEQAETNMAAEIVSQFAAEFSLDKVDQTEEMDTLPIIKPSDIVQVNTFECTQSIVSIFELITFQWRKRDYLFLSFFSGGGGVHVSFVTITHDYDTLN